MSTPEVIVADKLPKPVGPYSLAKKVDGLIFTAGQIPLNPATGQLVSADFEQQVRQILDNLRVLLAAANSDLQHVIKCTVFLTNLDNFATLNRVFSEYFAQNPPARSAVQVSRLPLNAQVEIEAIAVEKHD